MTVAVQFPQQHQDALDKLSKAINIGTSIYGIKLASDKYGILQQQAQLAQEKELRAAETEKLAREKADRLSKGLYMPGELHGHLEKTKSKFSETQPQRQDLSALGLPYTPGPVEGAIQLNPEGKEGYVKGWIYKGNDLDQLGKMANIKNALNRPNIEENKISEKQKNLHNKLSKDAQSLASKFEPVADYYGRMLQTYKTEGIDGLRSTSSLEDYIKIIDPSAVIRMGKIDVMKESMSPIDKLAFMAKKMKEGGVVDEKQIKGMLKLAGQAYEEKLKLFKDQVESIQDRARKYGLPEDWIPAIMPIKKFYNPTEEYNKAIQSREGKKVAPMSSEMVNKMSDEEVRNAFKNKFGSK